MEVLSFVVVKLVTTIRYGDYIQLYTTTKKIIIDHFNIYFVYI